MHFEKVAINMKWPKEHWPALVQSVLTGKGRSTYLSLSLEQSSDYDVIKKVVSQAYDLTAENYRVKFRRFRKDDKHTYIEYAHNVENLFSKWISAADVNGSYDELKRVILLEQYLRGVLPEVSTYLMEREVTNIEKAATLAENFSLINMKNRTYRKSNERTSESHTYYKGSNGKKGFEMRKPPIVCFGCKEEGHIKSKCPKKDVQDKGVVRLVNNLGVKVSVDPQEGFKPFQFEGHISASENDIGRPVRIMRDTCASQSIILRNAMSDVGNLTKESVLLSGIGGTVLAPLCQVYLRSDLVSGYVTMAVEDSLEVDGVQILLGNDLAGKKVVPNPVVCFEPLIESPTQELEKENPYLFPSCVVTRSRAGLSKDNERKEMDATLLDMSPSSGPSGVADEENSLIENAVTASHDDGVLESSVLCGDDLGNYLGNELEGLDSSLQNLFQENSLSSDDDVVSRSNMIEEQRKDESLSGVFNIVVNEEEVKDNPVCFYLKSGLLMRKHRPSDIPADASWGEVNQLVVPQSLRGKVLSLAHDLGGHFGVNKTKSKILKHFYWPKIHNDVANYCKCCHVCQLAGKPNQKIKPAPLQPISVIGEPFSRVMIDCVGPLPKTRKGNQYLLTIMCSSTRYPEAIPLRNISSKVIVNELTKFFTKFGIPGSVQSDQGTNFTSKLFKEAMKMLGVKHYLSSPYHPESQGALERFHQTLKSMLTKYCFETEKDWDDGVPYMLFYTREACQESLGFSPNELLFGRELRGPLKLLYESWTEEPNRVPLLDYVQNLRNKLQETQKFAFDNLKLSQKKMKANFDKKTKVRKFNSGDEVSIFLPIRQYPLQNRYQGPYKILSQQGNNNYVIATPDRRKKKRLVHVNLLKVYHCRNEKVKAIRLFASC